MYDALNAGKACLRHPEENQALPGKNAFIAVKPS